MGRRYARDWRGRFATTGSGRSGRVKSHGSRKMQKAGYVTAKTRRNSSHSVSVIQRDRSGSNRVRQTSVYRQQASRVPLSRKRAIRISAAATSVPLKRGETRLVVKRRQGSTRVAKRNVYAVVGDT